MNKSSVDSNFVASEGFNVIGLLRKGVQTVVAAIYIGVVTFLPSGPV